MAKKEQTTEEKKTTVALPRTLSGILLRPRVTEKATDVSAVSNAYVFEVSDKTTKPQVISAVKEIYKVTPKKVAMVKIPRKKIFVRGKWGVRSGGKKAYVYLKSGDKIEFV